MHHSSTGFGIKLSSNVAYKLFRRDSVQTTIVAAVLSLSGGIASFSVHKSGRAIGHSSQVCTSGSVVITHATALVHKKGVGNINPTPQHVPTPITHQWLSVVGILLPHTFRSQCQC